MSVRIYHNPRCSKSRQTLALLEENGHDPEIILYLETPPDVKTLKSIIKKLGIPAVELLRKKDAKSLGLPETDDEEALIELMAANPKIIERPIVISGSKARIGRPPEAVLEIV